MILDAHLEDGFRFLENCPKNSKILGVDKINLEFIPDVKFIQNDIFDDDILKKIESFFEGKKIDLILSDMSPNSSGNKKVDHLRIISLIEKVLDLSDFFIKKWIFNCKNFSRRCPRRSYKKNEQNSIFN